MAGTAITPTTTDLQLTQRSHIISWAALTTANDTGAPIEMPASSIRSIQFGGTFGSGGTVVIEGSNDGVTYATLHDYQGTAISKTSATLVGIEEITRFIRPRLSAGEALVSSVTATLLVVRPTS